MNEQLFKYLENNSKLTQEEIEHICSTFQEKGIKKNEFWIKQDKYNNDLVFMCTGILRVFHEYEGDEITIQFILPNSFAIPLSSFVNNSKSLLNYQAVTDCGFLLVDKDVHHKVMFKYAKAFDLSNNYYLKAYADLESKFLSLLHLNAEQRFQKLFSEQPQIFNLVPLKHIASTLGITAETLSRLRKKTNKLIS